jgi:hypothetical protein
MSRNRWQYFNHNMVELKLKYQAAREAVRDSDYEYLTQQFQQRLQTESAAQVLFDVC